MRQQIDTGSIGAKQQTFEQFSARALLRRIVDGNPEADDETIFQEFAAQAGPHWWEIVRYWFANNVRAMRARNIGPSVDRFAARKASQFMLLDCVLPNGKMLRDCTFADASKAGGWLTRLGRCGQPSDVIGATMTEKEVRAVFKRAT